MNALEIFERDANSVDKGKYKIPADMELDFFHNICINGQFRALGFTWRKFDFETAHRWNSTGKIWTLRTKFAEATYVMTFPRFMKNSF